MDASGITGWPAAATLAARQHGRVTTAQLAAVGVSRSAIEKAVRSGRLHREHVGVYAVGHRAPSRHGRWMSAVLAAGPRAVLSHRSAATLHRLRDGERRRVDVTIPAGTARRRPGLAIHRAPLTPADVMVKDGVPVVSVARLLVDLAHDLEPDDLTRALREAQYRHVFDLEATLAALERRPSRVLADLLDDLLPASSPLDDAFLRLLARHHLPRPEGQHGLLGHQVDYAWPDHRVAVELDGFGAHTTLDAFQRDRSQANALQLGGWLVLRFTRSDVLRRPARTAGTVRRALARRG